jgi:hypothetical protein
MARAHGCDSHTGGRMLDHSIRDPLAPSISPVFYGWIGWEVPSSMEDMGDMGTIWMQILHLVGFAQLLLDSGPSSPPGFGSSVAVLVV